MKKKVGRPKKQASEKKVVWAFTIEKAKKDAALKICNKKWFDDLFIQKLTQIVEE